MLNQVDLGTKMKKEELKEVLDEKLGYELGKAQRHARAAGMPVILVIEGWRHSRRSEIVGTMMQFMDARGFRVYSSTKFNEEDRRMPFFSKFWRQLPEPGNMSVYRHSWYYLKNAIKVKKENEAVSTSFEHINAFEKQLTDGHYCLLKFFIHMSEEQQKNNEKDIKRTLAKAWRPYDEIYSEVGSYDKFKKCYSAMMEATNTENAPWHLISGDDLEVAKYQVFTTVVEEINKAVKAFTADKAAKKPSTNQSENEKTYDVLSKVDLSKTVDKDTYKEKLEKYQEKIRALQAEAFYKGVSAVFAFEGWDAAGKGGAIRRLTAAMDPLSFAVYPYAAPNAVERMYHYLWRFWQNVPAPGEISIFDRTWYGRVMVERIEKLTPDVDWRRGYAEINEMEKQWSEANMVLAKFWLQIDQEEQARRFKDREENPEKEWKITEEDWRNRAKWSDYEAAVNEMIARTNTDYAPWIIVEANSKYYARLKVLETVIDLLEKKLK